MPSTAEHPKDATRVAAGLKAAIHNPNVSEEARERALEKLKEMGQDVDPAEEHLRTRHHEHDSGDPNRVLAGYKATLSNPYTSTKAKTHAEEVLQAAGIRERLPDHSEEEHQTRVLAGYKAALHSMSSAVSTTPSLTLSLVDPRVSDEAKQHAREYLQEHGVEV